MAFVIKRKTADGSLVDLDIATKYDSEGNEIPLHYATKEELGAKPGLFYCTAESSGGGDSLLYVSVDTISPSGVKVNDLIMWKGRLYLAYDVSGSVYANFLYDLNGATGAAGNRWWVTQVEIPEGASYIAKTGTTDANINDWVISSNEASNAACAQIFSDTGTKWAVRRYGFLCTDGAARQDGNGIYYSREEATSETYTFDKASLQPVPTSGEAGALIVTAGGYLYQCTSVLADGTGYDCTRLISIKGADGATGATGSTGAAGTDGLSIFSGTLVDLSEGTSVQACRASDNDRYFLPGDLYLNTGNYNLYKCKSVQILNGSSVWSLVGNIKGEKGDTGASGSGGGISVTPYLLEISEGVDYNILELAAKKSIKVYAMSYGSAHIYDDENTIDLNVTNAEIVLVTADSEVNVGVSGWKCEDGTNMEPVIGATIISSGDNSLHIYSNDVPILLSVLA